MRKIVLFVVLAGLLPATACRKKGKEQEYTFVNHLFEDITLDIYYSKENYDQQSNKVSSLSITANSNYRMPLNSLEEGHTYYIDWYTADFEYNNWVIDAQTGKEPYVAYTPGPGNYSYIAKSEYRGPGRNTFLSGYDTATQWKAVDAYAYTQAAGYTSTWSLLDANQKQKEVRIRKSGVLSYTFLNNSGTAVTDHRGFTVLVSPRAYIEIPLENSTTFSLTGGELPTGDPNTYQSSSTDTVMGILDNTGYLYMMVKQ